MPRAAIEMFSTFGVAVLCIALGIMLLALFLKLLNRFTSSDAKTESIAVRGILKKDTWATVHLVGSETFDRVRFQGFTSSEGMKNNLP